MKKIRILNLTLAVALLTGLFLLAGQIQAAVRCETQYGGGETCVRTGELQIDKEVWNSADGKFVDNLGITSHKFASGEEIVFKLKIKNAGDETFEKVSVTDTLPSYLELISGDLSFEITDLTPGETEEREIKTRVVSADRFPNDESVVCVVNTAEAWADGEHDKDTAQVCAEEKVLGVTTLPETGPQGQLLVFFLSFIAGAAGLSLIKFKKFSLNS